MEPWPRQVRGSRGQDVSFDGSWKLPQQRMVELMHIKSS